MTVSTGVKSHDAVSNQGTQSSASILMSMRLCCVYIENPFFFFCGQSDTRLYHGTAYRDPYLSAKNVYFALDVSGPTGPTIDPDSPLIH